MTIQLVFSFFYLFIYFFSGGYVYFDVFSQQNRQEVIRLVGPNMTSGGIGRPRLCLTFWFAAFGAGDTTQLRVLMMDSVAGFEKGTAFNEFASCMHYE